MSDNIITEVTVNIKRELSRLHKSNQRALLWALLKDELSANPEAITVFLDDLGKFLDDQGDKLIGQFN